MKRLPIYIALLFLGGCQRACVRCDKAVQVSERNYTITMFSGGDTVFIDRFKGIVNNSEHSDGIYHYNNDGDLIEISGDYVIKSN